MFDPFYLTLALILSFFILEYRSRCRKRNPDGLPFPPGPAPLPMIGNMTDLPKSEPWLTYTDWSKDYGDLVHAKVLGHSIVIVNSTKVANDLFEKRSQIYSDRPPTTMIDLMGWDHNMAFIPYGDNWRQHHRLFHQKFRQEAALNFRPIQLNKVHQLLRGLADTPDDFMFHLRHMAASIILSAVYGYEIQSNNDPFIELAERAMSMLSTSTLPGAAVVNALPFLRHLPDWFPGTAFKEFGRKCSKLTAEMQEAPLNFVKRNMDAGTATPSVTSELLEENEAKGGSKDMEGVIKRVSATTYAAGGDTTVSVLATAILAMVLHPEVQEKAQAEIDNAIGTRLPEFSDRKALPYVEAFYREVLRWRPATPLSLLHATTQDDFYDGYFIPKGATIIPNAWAMLHDGKTYSKPDEFHPERFLLDDGSWNGDIVTAGWGFGRRVCAGRHMADATVWSTIVSVLAAFRISKAKDEAGREIEISGKYTDGLIVHPLPFKCSIIPRSGEWRKLVEETAYSHKAQ